jgi:hypothetical protein
MPGLGYKTGELAISHLMAVDSESTNTDRV